MKQTTYVRRMLAGGLGPLSSLVVLVLLPIVGAFLLPADEYAVWVIFNSVASIALSLDFGGTPYVAANANSVSRTWPVIWRGIWMSVSGTVIICAVGMLLWIPYSATAAAGSWSLFEGELALGAILLASVLRSASYVIGAAALAKADYVTRNTLLVVPAILVVLTATGIILTTHSAWALPIGWLIAVAASLAIVTPRLVRQNSASPRDNPASLPGLVGTVKDFTVKRTIATIIGSVLLQGDRWVVGAVAGPAFLAGYDLVWRFASAPRLAAMSITATLVSDSNQAFQSNQLRDMANSAIEAVWATVGVIAVCAVACIVGLGLIGQVEPGMVLIGLVLTVSFSLQGRTSVTSTVGIGLGRAGIDLPYFTILLCVTPTIWLLGALFGSVVWIVVGSSVAFGVASIGFIRISERKLLFMPGERLSQGRNDH